jgi:glycosyltransferase involved in cell wall biosynthesis
MPEVSIILPVYNVAAYIGACVASIAEQTFGDFELIVVDDASTDGSIAELRKTLEGLRVDWRLIRHPVNRGLAAARNTGIDHAQGKYLYFPDSDDTLEPGLLAFALDKLQSRTADIVVFGLRSVYEDPGRPSEEDVPDLEAGLNGEEALAVLLKGACRTYICTQVFRRSIFEGGVRFPEGYVYEDRFSAPYLFLAAARVCFVRQVFYNYRQRAGSITKTFQPGMVKNAARIEALARDLSARLPGREWRRIIRRFTYQNLYSMVLVAMIRGERRESVLPIWKECRTYIHVAGLVACFPSMPKPVIAMVIFKISPRLFWQLFRQYYLTRHKL